MSRQLGSNMPSLNTKELVELRGPSYGRISLDEARALAACILQAHAGCRESLECIVMGDSGFSYDFGDVSPFLGKLEEGFDLVVGNHFAGSLTAIENARSPPFPTCRKGELT